MDSAGAGGLALQAAALETRAMKDVQKALARTAEILRGIASEPTWVIPQSGGKDSRTTGQVPLYLIRKGVIKPPDRIVYYMADTLMEYDVFMRQAERGLWRLRDAAEAMGIEAHAFITHPLPQDDFFVRIIGYGFCPPTTNMRTCTDKLKIAPPRKVLQRMGWHEAPVLLGVRWGESERRDQVLTCKLGGECGPDSQYHAMMKSKTHRHRVVTPVIDWELCAVWDWLTFHSEMEGFDNRGLIDCYGPNGDLRYGCWTCPLIFNDTTGEYLAQSDPKIHEMIRFAHTNFRPGGAAWRFENRELIEKKNGVSDGRLSFSYCNRLYAWLLDFEERHGVMLLRPWQKQMIGAILAWRADLPAGQLGLQPLELWPETHRAAGSPMPAARHRRNP